MVGVGVGDIILLLGIIPEFGIPIGIIMGGIIHGMIHGVILGIMVGHIMVIAIIIHLIILAIILRIIMPVVTLLQVQLALIEVRQHAQVAMLMLLVPVTLMAEVIQI